MVEDIANDKVRRRDLKSKHGSLGEELANIEREGDKLQRLQRHQQAAEEKKTKLATAVNERWQRLGEVLDVSSADDVMRMLDMENLNGELARKKYARDEEVSEKERELQHEKAKENRKNQEMVSQDHRASGPCTSAGPDCASARHVPRWPCVRSLLHQYVKQEAMRTLEDSILRDEASARRLECARMLRALSRMHQWCRLVRPASRPDGRGRRTFGSPPSVAGGCALDGALDAPGELQF